MTKIELINKVCNEDEYKNLCKKFVKGSPIYKDLYQDLIVTLLEYPSEKIDKLECPDCFVYKVLSNMVFSKTSSFHYKYRNRINEGELKHYLKTESTYNNNTDTIIDKSKKIIDNLYWYDKEIFNLYLKTENISQVSEETNIPRKSIERTIKKIRKQIKSKLMPVKILLIVQKKTTGLEFYRQLVPHERLQKIYGEDVIIHQKVGHEEMGKTYESTIEDLEDEVLKEYNVVCFLRQISHDRNKIQPCIDRLKSLGIKIVLDIDDYWELPKEHYYYNSYKENKVADSTVQTIRQVDYVTTTTDTFKNIIYEFNKNVSVTANCIDPDDPQFKSSPIESNRLRFGWIGGVHHREDIKLMKEGIERLYAPFNNKDIKDKWQICLGGYSTNTEYNAIERILTANYEFNITDKTYYNYLSQNTPAMEHISYDKPYRRLWAKDYKSYGTLYNEVDVCLVPLKNNVFNNCKSELKIVEAGWMKKAVIISDTLPYNKWIKDGVNGLIARSSLDWYIAMRKMILNPNMVTDLAERLHETIKQNFDIDAHNKKRMEIYQGLV